jgi:hypothetical protein
LAKWIYENHFIFQTDSRGRNEHIRQFKDITKNLVFEHQDVPCVALHIPCKVMLYPGLGT